MDYIFEKNKLYKVLSFSTFIIIAAMLTIVISNKIDYEPNSNVDPNFQVTDIEKQGDTIVYYVTSRGFTGKTSIKSKITMKDNNITNLEIIENKESYYHLIDNSNFVNDIVENQNSLDNVEAVSGATYTSNYLKELIQKIKVYDRIN